MGAFASSEALTEPLEAIAKMLQLSMGPLATANLIDTMKSATAEIKDSFGIDDMHSQLDSWRLLESGAAQHCTFETF